MYLYPKKSWGVNKPMAEWLVRNDFISGLQCELGTDDDCTRPVAATSSAVLTRHPDETEFWLLDVDAMTVNVNTRLLSVDHYNSLLEWFLCLLYERLHTVYFHLLFEMKVPKNWKWFTCSMSSPLITRGSTGLPFLWVNHCLLSLWDI